MEISNLLWTTGGLAFFTGLVIGIVLYHFLAGGRPAGNLRSRVTELEAELKDYKDKVADHFSTSAHLVNRLTDTYRDVHEHLATSANELCVDELTKHRLSDALLAAVASAIKGGSQPLHWNNPGIMPPSTPSLMVLCPKPSGSVVSGKKALIRKHDGCSAAVSLTV